MKKYFSLIAFLFSFSVSAQFSSDLVLQLHSGTQAEMITMNTADDKTKLFYNTTDNKIYYNDGTSWLLIGTDNTKDAWKDNPMNTRIELITKSDGTTARDADTEFVINDDGNVGIGTSNPSSSKIQIEGNGEYGGIMRIINTDTGGANFFMGSTKDGWTVGANKFVMGHGNPLSTNVDGYF